MSPRRTPRAALALVLIVLAGAAIHAFGATPVQPNVVVIMTDDQTVEQLRVMSRTRALIADAGVTFRNAFASFPLCCPSRATFLTGQYAHNHGVLENDPPTGGYDRLDHTRTLPVWLQQAGYRTIHVGKYLNEYGAKDPTEIPPGWTDWTASVDPTTYRMWGYTLNENGSLNTYGTFDDEDPARYQTDVYRDKAVAAIHDAAANEAPFFLNVWFLAPHREVLTLAEQIPPRSAPRHRHAFDTEPLPRPPSFNEADMSDKPLFMQVKPAMNDAAIAEIEERYRAELETLLAVDEAVEAIVGALDEEGVLDDTYIIFLSDNGFFHGEHRTPVEKILGYEPSVRVPLLMRGPGIPAGSFVDELVANVDLAPTITELSGARADRTADGRSLKPFVADPALRTTRPILFEAFFPVGSALSFFTEQFGVGSGASDAAGPSIPLSQTIMPYQAVRTDRYVYLEYLTGEHELYDLERDPDQLTSVHLDPRYLRTQLALLLRLERLRLCQGDGCRAEAGPIPDPT